MKLPLFIKAFFSPFKRPKLVFYFGKTNVGVPYHLPRKWVPYTRAEANEAALKRFNNVNFGGRSLEQWEDHFLKCKKAVPKKIGFDFCDLGWKTKFNCFRFESNPVWSFVFFGYQIALKFEPEHDLQYWECFLAYQYDTNKKLSKKERLREAKEKHSCIWVNKETTTDYWKLIIK